MVWNRNRLLILAAGIIIACSLYWLIRPGQLEPITLEGEISENKLPTIESKNQLNEYYLSLLQAEQKASRGWFSTSREDSAMEEKSSDSSSAGAEMVSMSETNVQVEGVDEADVVKTDGAYIYQINESNVFIVSTNDEGSLSLSSTITFDHSFQPAQLLLYDTHLVVLGHSYLERSDKTIYEESKKDAIYPQSNERTTALIYNIQTPNAPVLEREIRLDGALLSARELGGKIYLVANYTPSYWMLEDNQEIDLRPRVLDTSISNKEISIPYKEIQYFPGSKEKNFTTIASFDLTLNDTPVSILTYLGSGNQLYMSKENLYLAIENWGNIDWAVADQAAPNTTIYKFSVKDLSVTYTATTEVPGIVLNQFSMDEYDGFFRVATTEGFAWDERTPSKNHLFIFDQNLNKIGALQNLAKGERIYSARFIGSRIYIVTFKETDPLFVIDATTPSEPKIVGELKIPGFSNYLHPLDENHLIGFGYETKLVSEKGQSEPLVLTEGVKMSLFDLTDVSNPKETFVEIIGDRGTYSPLNYDHKSLLFNSSTGLFAFPISVYKSVPGSEYEQSLEFQGAYVYRVTKDKGFELEKKLSHTEGNPIYEEWETGISRLIYINNNLYAISPGKITSTRLSNYDSLDEIRFN